MGTITLSCDHDNGLAADETFGDQIDKYRLIQGSTVCELTKLAYNRDWPSQRILASLFHIVFIFGNHKYNCTDLFIEVNPRHRRFYQAMLGFKAIGELRINQSVDAPSQLMHLPVSTIAANILKHADRPSTTACRSLYPLFLNPTEQQRVHDRLVSFPSRKETADKTVLDLHRTPWHVADVMAA